MKKLIILTIIFLFNGCSRTINAWSNATPKEYLEIYGKDDLPSKLKVKQVEYKCVDLIYSSTGNSKKCYIRKSSTEKVDGWVTRFYNTSKGVLLDTGENIVIIGIIGLCSMGGDCRNVDFSKVKLDK